MIKSDAAVTVRRLRRMTVSDRRAVQAWLTRQAIKFEHGRSEDYADGFRARLFIDPRRRPADAVVTIRCLPRQKRLRGQLARWLVLRGDEVVRHGSQYAREYRARMCYR